MNSMDQRQNIRTDLALEIRESFQDDNVEIKGVILEKIKNNRKNIEITNVVIEDEQGSKAMRKPIGRYITIEAPKLNEEDDDYHRPLSDEIAKYIEELAGGIKHKSVLIAGLGNREVTPDSLGPKVIDNLFVTRHLIKEFGQTFKEQNRMEVVSAIAPGVMAQTGMETGEIVHGIIKETKPNLVIVIDALAARSVKRLNTTVQISDTGISPGSGVGNNRKALNLESMGIPVISLGVPTVVDAATIIGDSMEEMLQNQGYNEEQIAKFLGEMENPSMRNMFVTPKNIDESMKRISFTISEALNQCFYKY